MQKEKDPELRDQALLALAGRLERSERFSAATQIYSVLQQGSSGVSDRARGRLQALLGSGTFGAQAEAALGQLFSGIADPAALAAMGAAGATYRLVRLATLSRLAAVPHAGLLTRGWGARSLASSLAFAAEGGVFPAAHRWAARASGSKPAAAGFGEEILSSYCFLGGLRLAAFASGGLTRGRSLGWGTGLLRQGSMLGGILLGSGLEKSLGLRAEAAWASTLAQSLATLLHFNAAGALFRSLSGARFQSWEKGIDLQIRKLETGLPFARSLDPSFAGSRLAPAPAGELVWRMADGGNDGKPLLRGQKVPPLTLTFDETLAPRARGVTTPKAEAKTQAPSSPIANPELEVIFTLAMAGSSRNKPRFDAEMSSLPKKLEKMNEAQLQTVVKQIVTQIIENPL
ncbi:MAG TPA: hypothetical protein VJR29_09115, partial [bacterium]|nr:hypothetical protein [bacterium]